MNVRIESKGIVEAEVLPGRTIIESLNGKPCVLDTREFLDLTREVRILTGRKEYCD